MLLRPLSRLYHGSSWSRSISFPLWVVDFSCCAKDSPYIPCFSKHGTVFNRALLRRGPKPQARDLRFQSEHPETLATLLKMGFGAHTPCVTGFMLLQLSSPLCPFWCNGCSFQHPRGVHAEVRMGKAAVSSGIASASRKRRETCSLKHQWLPAGDRTLSSVQPMCCFT